MPCLKWLTTAWDVTITPQCCVRETALSVWIRRTYSNAQGHFARTERYSKRTARFQYWDSWEAAHAYLLAREIAHVAHCQEQLTKAEKGLALVQAMTPPDSPEG